MTVNTGPTGQPLTKESPTDPSLRTAWTRYTGTYTKRPVVLFLIHRKASEIIHNELYECPCQLQWKRLMWSISVFLSFLNRWLSLSAVGRLEYVHFFKQHIIIGKPFLNHRIECYVPKVKALPHNHKVQCDCERILSHVISCHHWKSKTGFALSMFCLNQLVIFSSCT